MKVLVESKNNQKIWKGKFTCTGRGWVQTGIPCRSILEVDATDLRTRLYTDLYQETTKYYGFVCPICGCYTEINARKLPEIAKRMAQPYKESVEDA